MKKFIITEEEKRHILSLYNLVEDFKSQKKKFIDQGYDESIVDTYLNDFREIKDKRYKEASDSDLEGVSVPKGNDRFNIDSYKTFHELEVLVDYVSGQRKVGSKNFSNIVVDGKPVAENEDVEIFYAPNRESCVKYKGDNPYSWCISRKDSSNMFQRYRYSDEEPTFYFVKLKKRTKKEFEFWNNSNNQFTGQFNDKYHFVVIQVVKGGRNYYVLTSANNDGDKRTTWEEILKIIPELEPFKDYFKYVPVAKEEKEKYKYFAHEITDEEYSKLSYTDKELYIDSASKLSFNKFKISPDDLKNKYIGLGIPLTKEQYNLIKNNKKLLNRYVDVLNQVFTMKEERGGNYNIQPFEYINLNETNKQIFEEKNKKSYINQSESVYSISTISSESEALGYLTSSVDSFFKNKTPDYKSGILNVFYTQKFVPQKTLETYCKNKNFMFYMLVALLVQTDDENQRREFFNYVEVNPNTFMSSLSKEQLNLVKKVNDYKANIKPEVEVKMPPVDDVYRLVMEKANFEIKDSIEGVVDVTIEKTAGNYQDEEPDFDFYDFLEGYRKEIEERVIEYVSDYKNTGLDDKFNVYGEIKKLRQRYDYTLERAIEYFVFSKVERTMEQRAEDIAQEYIYNR